LIVVTLITGLKSPAKVQLASAPTADGGESSLVLHHAAICMGSVKADHTEEHGASTSST
jgi:hypothetical protein